MLVGGVVAQEDGMGAGEGRLTQEGGDTVALSRARGAQFLDHVAVLQDQARLKRDATGEVAGGAALIGGLAVVQGDG
jgi:hypothetical protein